MILHCYDYGALKIKSSKQKTDNLSQEISSIMHLPSCSPHLLRSARNTLPCPALQVHYGYLPQVVFAANTCHSMTRTSVSSFVSSPSYNVNLLQSSPSPSLDDTFAFHKSIFETQQLPRATGRQRKSISQRSWRCSIASPVTTCLPVSKPSGWTSVVKITRVNSSHLTGWTQVHKRSWMVEKKQRQQQEAIHT